MASPVARLSGIASACAALSCCCTSTHETFGDTVLDEVPGEIDAADVTPEWSDANETTVEWPDSADVSPELSEPGDAMVECASALTPCQDPDGVVRCADLTQDLCHCGSCGYYCPGAC